MTPPAFYIVAERIKTVFWLHRNGIIHECGFCRDGTPDWGNFSEVELPPSAGMSIDATTQLLSEYIEARIANA